MKTRPKGLTNTVRIIGGKWRGKKLVFPSIEGLRPTPDRIRETVFNWLQFELQGARVLDLFAGSGAFGLEALSRGAAYVLFVDKQSQVTAQLKQQLHELNIENAHIQQSDALEFLQQQVGTPFDVVFLDPPYGKQLIGPCVKALENGAFLAEKAFIYIETESQQKILHLPANWHLHRSKRGAQIGYHLAIREQQEREP